MKSNVLKEVGPNKHIKDYPVKVLNKSNGEIITLRPGFDLRTLNKFVFEVIDGSEKNEQ